MTIGVIMALGFLMGVAIVIFVPVVIERRSYPRRKKVKFTDQDSVIESDKGTLIRPERERAFLGCVCG